MIYKFVQHINYGENKKSILKYLFEVSGDFNLNVGDGIGYMDENYKVVHKILFINEDKTINRISYIVA